MIKWKKDALFYCMKTSIHAATCICAVLFFIFSSHARAANSDIIITEIAAYEKSDHEWIEIYNIGSDSVDLTGWKFFENSIHHGLSAYRGDLVIEAGEYAVIADVAANTAADYPSFSGTLLDSSWETLNESGESIALKDASGTIIEQFTYGAAPDYSLERKNPYIQDYSFANWAEHASGNTIGAQNSNAVSQQQASPPPQPPPQSAPPENQTNSSPSSTQEKTISPPQANAQQPSWTPVRGDVLINEFVSDPSDNEKEWIELHNGTNKEISLDGWTIEDGSKAVTQLTGVLGTSGEKRFFIIEDPKGNLNNAGDRIALFNQRHEIIDDVSYGNFDDGNVLNNAPRAYDPHSVARILDGQNTYNNSNDFRTTTTRTMGMSNIITIETGPDGSRAQEGKKAVAAKDIQISEVLPHPAVSEGQEEFIELLNTGKTDVDLSGWFLVSEIGQRYVISQKDFSSTIVKPDAYFVITRKKSNIALKNTGGDNVKLYQLGAEKASAVFTYHENAHVGLSAVKDSDGFVIWTKTPTSGAKNIFVKENRAPDISVSFPSRVSIGESVVFDASDTIDAEREPLTFQWDFGDGQTASGDFVRHMFSKSGDFTVTLRVRDAAHETTETRRIKIVQKEQRMQQISLQSPAERSMSGKAISGDVKIEQVYPNPAGRDSKEFIILKNISSAPLDISGWSLKTEKSEKIFTFPSETIIEPQKIFSLLQTQSGLRLQNTSDAVYVFNKEGGLVDAVDYEDAPEDRMLMRAKDGIWKWMKVSAQGSTQEDRSEAAVTYPRTTRGKNVKVIRTAVRVTQESVEETSIKRIRTFDIGSSVRFRAIVSAEPGILGKMIFYVTGSGIQIYNSRKNFPELRAGDTVEISGTLQESSDEMRVRIAGKDAIRVLSRGTAPAPEPAETSAIDETVEGHLVRIQGEVIEIRWPYIYVDDGGGEVRVYVKKSTNIEKRKLYIGDELSVTGIVSQTAAGYRILPRYESDIVLIKNPEKEKSQEEETIPDRSKETKTIFQYLVAIGVTATLISTGLFIQYKMKG